MANAVKQDNRLYNSDDREKGLGAGKNPALKNTVQPPALHTRINATILVKRHADRGNLLPAYQTVMHERNQSEAMTLPSKFNSTSVATGALKD